jgi:hypothetical protein
MPSLHGLLLPDPKPHLVDYLHQDLDVPWAETTAKVPRRRGIGNPLRAQRIEIDLVVAQELEVLQTPPVGQEVVGDVEHVIGLVVGQVHLQQLQAAIDLFHQSRGLGHSVDRPEAPNREAARPLGDLVVDIGCPEHRTLLIAPGAVPEAVLDAALAISEISLCTLLHSKWPSLCGGWLGATPSIPHRDGPFEAFRRMPTKNLAQFTLV